MLNNKIAKMNIQTNYECLLKLLILGDSNVGKTNFLLRFTENSFLDNYITTIGFDYKSSVVKLDNERTVKLQIWDTAGQERFMSVTKNLMLRVQGVILMYDITEPVSFENVKKWFKSIRENTNEKMPIVLVGNKIDLEDKRKVSIEKGEKLAEEYEIKFFEASAKDNRNVEEAFIEIAKEVMKTYNPKGRDGKMLERGESQQRNCC